jgi:hypothetical protein
MDSAKSIARKIVQTRTNSLLSDNERSELNMLYDKIIELMKETYNGDASLFGNIYDALKLAGYDDVKN